MGAGVLCILVALIFRDIIYETVRIVVLDFCSRFLVLSIDSVLNKVIWITNVQKGQYNFLFNVY